VTTLVLTYKGQAIWRAGQLAIAPPLINLNEGESLDEKLAEVTKPNIDLLKNTKLSGQFVRPGDATTAGAYGASGQAAGKAKKPSAQSVPDKFGQRGVQQLEAHHA
jgi:hypothetical protein